MKNIRPKTYSVNIRPRGGEGSQHSFRVADFLMALFDMK